MQKIVCGQQLVSKNPGIKMLVYFINKVTVHAEESRIDAS